MIAAGGDLTGRALDPEPGRAPDVGVEGTLGLGLPGGPAYASWLRRVAANLLDVALYGAVLYLAFPVQPVSAPLWPGALAPADPAAYWYQSGWAVAVLVLLFLMQAYLGATPGKLVMSIAVVRADTCRPAGLLRIVWREILHLLDLIFFIGYLRPLWHPRGQTFADSLAATVVLHTDRPLPHPWVERLEQLSPTTATGWWERTTRPRWLAVTTAVSMVAVAGGVALSIGPQSSTGGPNSSASCGVAAPLTLDREWAFVGGDLTVDDATTTSTRLGVTRTQLGNGEPGVLVHWLVDGTYPQDATLRLVLAEADGSMRRVLDHQLRDGALLPGAGVPQQGDLSVRLPLSVLDTYEPGWTWKLEVLGAGGGSAASCTGTDPTTAP